jgi:transposase
VHRDPARVEVLKPPTLGVPVLVDPTLMCHALVGLADVELVGVIGWTVPMQVHIASTLPRPVCASCGTAARVKQTLRRRLVDLPSFGRPVVTVWRQVRWRCPSATCSMGSWTQVDTRIVVGNRGTTDRAARWVCEQVGRHGRTVAEVAAELGCDWHTVNRAVIGYGLALVDDPDRIGAVTTLGLDETAFVRLASSGTLDDRVYCTEIRRLGRTLKRWGPQMAAWHRSHASNGPVEAIVKIQNVRRAARGFGNADNHAARIRLHAGQPRSVPTTTRIRSYSLATAA